MALSANAFLDKRFVSDAKARVFTITTGAVIYKDALLVLNAVGTALPAADTITTTFAGIAVENSSGSFPVTGDGTYTVKVMTEIEVKVPLVTAITVGDTNKTALYLVDDQTVTSANTLGPACGRMTQFVAANSGWVMLRAELGAAS